MIIIFRLAILYFKLCEPVKIVSRMDILNLVEKRRRRT